MNTLKQELASLKKINEAKREKYTEVSGQEPSTALSVLAGVGAGIKDTAMGGLALVKSGFDSLTERGQRARIEALRRENEALDELTAEKQNEIGSGNHHHA